MKRVAAQSCAFIERPSPLRKPSCKVRLFAQNRSRNYRQKVTATTPSQTVFHRIFQLLPQMAHVCFRRRKWVHTRLSEKDRTQRLTRRNRGRFGWGWYHYSRSVPHVHQHPRAGYQNGKFCRFWALVGDAPEERRKPSEQRCAYARRCSEGVAAPPGCVIFSVSVEIYGFTPRTQGFLCVRGGGGITTPGVRCVLPKFSAPACQSSLFAVF